MVAKRKPKTKQVGGSMISLLSGLLGGRKRVGKKQKQTGGRGGILSGLVGFGRKKPQKGGKMIGLQNGFSNRPPPFLGTW